MKKKAAPKSIRTTTRNVPEVPSRKMEDFKGCYTYTKSNQEMEITEVAGTWTIKISKTNKTKTNNPITVQSFKVTISIIQEKSSKTRSKIY